MKLKLLAVRAAYYRSGAFTVTDYTGFNRGRWPDHNPLWVWLRLCKPGAAAFDVHITCAQWDYLAKRLHCSSDCAPHVTLRNKQLHIDGVGTLRLSLAAEKEIRELAS